ncbi:MAG: hypothetical protein U0359_07855 [Byssovorax sp.]
MRSRRSPFSAAFLAPFFAAAFAAIFAACGDASSGTGASTTTSSTTSTGHGGGGGGTTTGTGNGGAGGFVDLLSLAIDPPSATLIVDQKAPKTLQYKAKGTFGGGAIQDVPAEFSVDDTAPGTIDAKTGLYTASNAAGGKVKVTASYNGKTAQADLTVIFQPVVDEGTVPMGAPGLFDPMTSTAVMGDPLSPEIAYPSDGTMFPQNIYRTLFQWRSKGMPLFHVHFTADFLDLSIYTDGAHPTCAGAKTGAGCWEASQQTWSWLVASAAGKAVKLTVEAADPAKPGKFYVGKSIDVLFSQNAVPGAIYYWSTTQAGVMRATVSDAAPSSFMTPNEVDECVACHTLSRNGKRLAADVGGENLWVVDVNGVTPPPVVFNKDNGKNIASAWATFNPDATRVVHAKGGVLRLRDGQTGATIGANNGAISLGNKFGTQPDWSPDGAHLTFAYGTNNKDRGVQGSSLAMLDQANDVFSNLVLVRTSTGGSDTYAYPMFDPTGQWIAYMHATGASDKNAAAQLFVASAKASADETKLDRADTIVADGVVPVGIANNMPTWAPTKDAAETRWIAFASKRDYGLVLAQGSAYGSGKQQLWVAAIDPAKLGQSDPSFPAFRLPFQLLNENNHRPFWAEDALEVPDGGVPDASTDGPCLGIDDDCSKGVCCEGLVCQPNANGSAYTCQLDIPN